jgi:hypothetical protein
MRLSGGEIYTESVKICQNLQILQIYVTSLGEGRPRG